MTRFIVGEVSKNWRHGTGVTGDDTPICTLFERMIEFNHQRGYRLAQFSLARMQTSPDDLNETIVAVFEQVTQGLA